MCVKGVYTHVCVCRWVPWPSMSECEYHGPCVKVGGQQAFQSPSAMWMELKFSSFWVGVFTHRTISPGQNGILRLRTFAEEIIHWGPRDLCFSPISCWLLAYWRQKQCDQSYFVLPYFPYCNGIASETVSQINPLINFVFLVGLVFVFSGVWSK